MTEQDPRLLGIIDLFDEAEAKLKEIEQLSSELSIPSVNELRYVGYHLTKALCSQSEDDFSDEVDRAERHAKRAIYDANEIGLIYLLEQVQLFQADYAKSTEIIDVIPDYIKLCRRVDEASDFMRNIRENNHKERDKYYAECGPHCVALKEIYQTLTLARPEINKREYAKSVQEKSSTRRFVITVLLMLTAICVSSAILYHNITDNDQTVSSANQVSP